MSTWKKFDNWQYGHLEPEKKNMGSSASFELLFKRFKGELMMQVTIKLGRSVEKEHMKERRDNCIGWCNQSTCIRHVGIVLTEIFKETGTNFPSSASLICCCKRRV